MTYSARQQAQSVIVASPDPGFRSDVVRAMQGAGWWPHAVESGSAALASVEETSYALLLLDESLPDLDASELVDMVSEVRPEMGVVLMDREVRRFRVPARHASSHKASCALQILRDADGSGYDDPLTAPADRVERSAPTDDTVPVFQSDEALPGMIGMSPAIHEVYRMVRLVAGRTTPVLITGETGTGKELVARALHECSPRRSKPMVVVNCAAIPEELLEAELFGFERGAFTGAVQSRVGRIRAAAGGTLFLDEVGEMPLAMQAKLLRFLQEGEVQRLGSSDVTHVDTRVVAATNMGLEEQVEKGSFRADLFYRLTVFPINIAPLRERTDDIMPLAEHFLEKLSVEANLPRKTITREGVRFLSQHPWPGNVRELEHVIERAFILSEDRPELLLAPTYRRGAGANSSLRRPPMPPVAVASLAAV